MFLPDDPRLRTHAFQIADARRHVLRPPAPDDEDGFHPSDDAALDTVGATDAPEQLSLFSRPQRRRAPGMQIHAVTPDGLAFDDEPEVDVPAPGSDPSLLPRPARHPHRCRSRPRGVAAAWPRSRRTCATGTPFVAQRLVDLTGWTHGKVNAEMNRLAGVTKVSAATTEQLERRLRYAESWLRRARGR